MNITLQVGDRTWRADSTRVVDISIPLHFTGDQPSFFDAPLATASPLSVGAFTGDVRTGASCNCSTYSLTPHCNGTHTESVGHITAAEHPVRALALEGLLPAQLFTVVTTAAQDVEAERDIVTQPHDRLITARALSDAAAGSLGAGTRALIVRTLPNPLSKRTRKYHKEPAPYFTSAAMKWIVAQRIEHLVVDVPSLDRDDDGGHLLCHRIFWGVPPREQREQVIERPRATVTEFAYIPDDVLDGPYVLSLQIPPFLADAAPSRPLLYPLVSP